MDKRRLIPPLLVVCVVLLAAWFNALAISNDYRLPNQPELFFAYAAVEANVPELCEKISPHALVIAGFSSAGHTVYLNRSLCYFETAIRHSDALLCLKVKSVHNIVHWGYRISSVGCWLEMAKGNRDASPIIPDDKTVLNAFGEMGYSADDAASLLPVQSLVSLRSEFLVLFRKRESPERIKRALAAKEKIAVEDYEFLSDMLAKHTLDINLCKQIRPGIRHPAVKPGDEEALDFRDTCILQAAIVSGNAAYCAELPNRPMKPGQPAIWWPANECRSEVKFQAQANKTRSEPLVYGYAVPDNEQQIVRLFHLLGYDLPKESDWPSAALADRYRDVLKDAGTGRVDRNDARVQTLLRRLRELRIKGVSTL